MDLDKDEPDFYTMYLDSKAGQNKWGGWGIEGRNKFKEFRDEISDARGSKVSERAEQWALKALRSENKIDELEAKRANSRCRKRKTDSHVSEDEEEGYVSYAESLGDDVPAKNQQQPSASKWMTHQCHCRLQHSIASVGDPPPPLPYRP